MACQNFPQLIELTPIKELSWKLSCYTFYGGVEKLKSTLVNVERVNNGFQSAFISRDDLSESIKKFIYVKKIQKENLIKSSFNGGTISFFNSNLTYF